MKFFDSRARSGAPRYEIRPWRQGASMWPHAWSSCVRQSEERITLPRSCLHFHLPLSPAIHRISVPSFRFLVGISSAIQHQYYFSVFRRARRHFTKESSTRRTQQTPFPTQVLHSRCGFCFFPSRRARTRFSEIYPWTLLRVANPLSTGF